MTTPPNNPKADEGLVERYLFTNGWTMRREVFAPFYWLLFDAERNQVDRDQYRNDLIPRHKLTVREHVDPDAARCAARSHGGM